MEYDLKQIPALPESTDILLSDLLLMRDTNASADKKVQFSTLLKELFEKRNIAFVTLPGEFGYNTLQEAHDESPSGTRIIILRDITLTETFTIDKADLDFDLYPGFEIIGDDGGEGGLTGISITENADNTILRNFNLDNFETPITLHADTENVLFSNLKLGSSNTNGLVDNGNQTYRTENPATTNLPDNVANRGGTSNVQANQLIRKRLSTRKLSVARLDDGEGGPVPFTALSSANSNIKITGDDLETEIQGIVAGDDGQHLIIQNGMNQNLIVRHESGSATAANRIALANEIDLTLVPNQSAKFIYDSTMERWILVGGVGSGSGDGGGKNYIDPESSKFEGGTIGSWETDNGAGSAASYLTLATTEFNGWLLEGAYSLLLTKSANDASGEYIKLQTLNIDPVIAESGLPVGFTCWIKTLSGYANGDLIFQFWDVTNNVELYAGGSEDLEILSGVTPFAKAISLNPTTAIVEVRVKVNSTSATLYRVSFDDFKLDNTRNIESIYRNYAEIDLTGVGDFTGGKIGIARDGRTVTIQILESLTFSSSNNPSSGNGVLPDWASAGVVSQNVFTTGSSIISSFVLNAAGAFSVAFRNYSGTLTAQTSCPSGQISYLMTDNLSQVISENELSQQIIEAKATSATTTIGTSATTIINGTKVYDSHNAYNTSTGQFTAPRSGTVIVGFSFLGGNVSSSSANTGIQATVYVAGSPVSQIANFRYQVSSVNLTPMGVGVVEVPVTKGQTVDVRMFRAAAVSSTSLTGAADYNYITFYMKPTLTTLGVAKVKQQVQTKILSADVTTNTTASDLTFSDLQIGMWYEVKGNYYMTTDNGAGDIAIAVAATHDNNIIDYKHMVIAETPDTTPNFMSLTPSFVFQATATSLTFVTSSASANSYLSGNGTRAETYVQLIPRPDLY